MKVSFDHATHQTIVTLERAETFRLIAYLHQAQETVPDSTADESAQLEDVLTDILT